MKSDKINAPDVTWVPLESLMPWKRNARKHSAESTARLSAGIRRFGFPVPITAWKSERRIAAGHGRRLAMQSLLAEDPSFVPRNAPPGIGPGFVPVMWTEFATEAQFQAFALSDNRQAKNAEDDEALMAAVLADLDAQGIDFDGMGFDEGEIDSLLEQLEDASTEPSDSDDDVPSTQDEHHSQPGEVYQLGPHRLVCGDSTEPGSWDLLLEGDTKMPAMLWSDPPYGFAYQGGTAEALTIQNDELEGEELQRLISAALGNAAQRCAKGASWYVASPDGPKLMVFAAVLSDLEVWRHSLVWMKDRFALSACDYHYRHETIFYGWIPGGPHYWCGDRKQDTIHEFPKPARNADHPTMKPVSLVRRHIENSSALASIVIDPFGGSGTTLIAAASSGRVCRTIEIDPRYCDVIRRRWTKWATEHKIDPGTGGLAAVED